MAASIIVKAKISGGTVKARATLGQTVVQYVGGGGGDGDPYTGPYTVTPTERTQTLRTNGKIMMNDVTIQPIPSNYGKISWNGVTLTVS